MTNKQKISNYQLSIINSRLPVVSSCSTVALQHRSTNRGFTLAELVVATAVMVIFVVGALTLYVRSNKLAVDQQQLAQTQHDVRSSMFLISRDVRSIGVGLVGLLESGPCSLEGYFLEGIDNENQGGAVAPDRLRIIGNFDVPLVLEIQDYQGAAAHVQVNPEEFSKYPYKTDPQDNDYEGWIGLIVPANCDCPPVVRKITALTGSPDGFNNSPGLAPGINPPGGLTAEIDDVDDNEYPNCDSDDFDGGYFVKVNIKEYWLDVTGNYPGLTAGQNGYLGIPNILYVTENDEGGNIIHKALAQNIENFQIQYNGDLDGDGILDGFTDWQTAWTLADIAEIRQIRIWILGRTENPFVSVTGTPPTGMPLVYQRPAIANSPQAADPDNHRRFLIETTANIRNLSLEVYNE